MAFLQVNCKSTCLDLNTSMNVILPETPCPQADGRWPVLYLLHGISSDHASWQRQTSIERYASRLPLAVVMPAVHRSFYADMKHGGKYWTFISEELPDICDRMFPLSTRREDRFVAGLSMGGYGALKLGLNCPDRFAAAASLSGALDVVGMMSVDADADRARYFADVFGSKDELVGSESDLPAVARRLIASGQPMPRFYMACGTEDFLYQDNRRFLAEFGESLGITFEEGPGGHTWDFWDAYIQRVLAWIR